MVARNAARLRETRPQVLREASTAAEAISAEMVVKAARSFSSGASEGIDGWHVRSVLGYAPSAAAELAEILRECEA